MLVRRHGLRAVTLLEVLVVVGIIAIIAALAVPSLTPIVIRARNRALVEEITGFVEEARRRATSTGRCHRVIKSGQGLHIERRDTPDCVNIALDTWTNVKTTTLAGTITIDGLPSDPDGIVFRPNSRLRGDGDLDTTDDGGRIWVIASSGDTAVVLVTPLGRICGTTNPSAPPTFAAPVVCP